MDKSLLDGLMVWSLHPRWGPSYVDDDLVTVVVLPFQDRPASPADIPQLLNILGLLSEVDAKSAAESCKLVPWRRAARRMEAVWQWWSSMPSLSRGKTQQLLCSVVWSVRQLF